MSPLTEPTRIVLRNGWQPMDPDAAAYITAVETADGQALEEKVKIAIDNFVLGCKADGIWDAIKASCILAGARTLSGALVPLVGTAPTNYNFVSGDYDRKTGLVGNGSTKYLDSSRNNNADPQNSNHNAVYATTAGTKRPGIYMSASASTIQVGDNNFGTNSGIIFNRNRNPAANDVGAASATGLIGLNRSSSASYVCRVSGVNYTLNTTSQTPFSGNITLYSGAGSSFFNDSRLAFYSIGEALDLALLDARVTDLINKFAEVIP